MPDIERVYNIPVQVKNTPTSKRTKVGIQRVRDFIKKHMKAEEKIWIDPAINQKLWENGMKNPPTKIEVKATKFEDGLVEVTLFKK